MSKGYVYVLSNPSMPGLLKIGKSIHGGKHRANQLFKTGTPLPFDLEFEILVDNALHIESEVHKELSSCREFKDREFFRADVWDVTVTILKHVACQFDHRVEQADLCDAVDSIVSLSDRLNIHPIIGCSASKFITEFAMHDAVSKYNKWADDRRKLFEERKNNNLDVE